MQGVGVMGRGEREKEEKPISGHVAEGLDCFEQWGCDSTGTF